MLTNPCFYVFRGAFPVLHFYYAHFQAILLLNKVFINKFLNTILKLNAAYILLLKTTKSK